MHNDEEQRVGIKKMKEENYKMYFLCLYYKLLHVKRLLHEGTASSVESEKIFIKNEESRHLK